jgi:protein SCO1
MPTLFFVLPIWILQVGCGDGRPPEAGLPLGVREVRGEFAFADENASQAEIVILAVGRKLDPEISSSLGKPFKFNIQPGDLSLLRNKNVFRGKVQETFAPSSGKSYLLHQVWPDEPSDRIRFNNANRLLKRDTLSLGDGEIRSVGDLLPPFALYDQDGNIITPEYFDGSATVLNFIFTRCSVAEMCPASTNKMKRLQELVQKTKIKHVRFLSITLDPLYDSPGILKQYAQAYNLSEENFRFGTAGKGVIGDLTRQFGILRKNDEKQTIDHTMRTFLVNARRQIIYQVPGKGWSVKDFLLRLQEGSKG